MAFIHKNLASGRWQNLSFFEQMGNIGSEYARAIYWEKAGDFDSRQAALERAIELTDLTVSAQNKPSRRLELLRLREVFCDLFANTKNYNISSKSLQNYFLPFALLARK